VHGFGFWWNENFENVKAKTRTKNDSPILKTTFWVLANQISFFENYS